MSSEFNSLMMLKVVTCSTIKELMLMDPAPDVLPVAMDELTFLDGDFALFPGIILLLYFTTNGWNNKSMEYFVLIIIIF